MPMVSLDVGTEVTSCWGYMTAGVVSAREKRRIVVRWLHVLFSDNWNMVWSW